MVVLMVSSWAEQKDAPRAGWKASNLADQRGETRAGWKVYM